MYRDIIRGFTGRLLMGLYTSMPNEGTFELMVDQNRWYSSRQNSEKKLN